MILVNEDTGVELDITDQIAGEVEFHFSDGAAPTVVRDAENASALYVLMPMRV